jgi:hypothetical protein
MREIDMVMRNFKVVPYPEVAETLEQATRDTIAFLNAHYSIHIKMPDDEPHP